VDGKTGEGIATLDPGTYEALKPLLARGTPYVFAAREGSCFEGAVKGQKRGKGYVYKDGDFTGDFLRKKGVYRRVSGIIRGSGVDVKGRKTGPHVLRHSFARLMLVKTGDLRLVQRLLRHPSITTTAIYTHLAQEDVDTKYQQTVAMWLS
jgi:integrase